LEAKYEEAMEEIQELKAACKDINLKVILESGILKIKDLQNAAIISMESGADFIKTSTGKLEKGASTTAAYCMCRMILEYYQKSGRKVGFKAAGGISSTEDALKFYCIVESVLGKDWLNKDLLRFGASRLANNVVNEIFGKSVNPF